MKRITHLKLKYIMRGPNEDEDEKEKKKRAARLF